MRKQEDPTSGTVWRETVSENFWIFSLNSQPQPSNHSPHRIVYPGVILKTKGIPEFRTSPPAAACDPQEHLSNEIPSFGIQHGFYCFILVRRAENGFAELASILTFSKM